MGAWSVASVSVRHHRDEQTGSTCKKVGHIPHDLITLRAAKAVYVVQAVYVGECEQHLVGAVVDGVWQLIALPVCRGAGQEDGFHDDALHVAAHVADEVHANQALHEGHHRLKAGKVCRKGMQR